MTKNILITGGAGFIGSNFVHHLFDRFPEYRIKVLDALTYAGDVANLPVGGLQGGRMEFVYGDVRNGELVNALVAESDIVVQRLEACGALVGGCSRCTHLGHCELLAARVPQAGWGA